MPTKTKKSAPKKKPAKKKPAPKPIGRPTKYKPEYCNQLIDFFNKPIVDSTGSPHDPIFLSAFGRSIGVCHDTLIEWTNVYPAFSEAYREAKHLQMEMIATNAVQDRYNGSFAWRMVQNLCGWRDKQDIDQNITLPPGLKISFDG